MLLLERSAVCLCPSEKDDVEIIVLQYLVCLLFSVGKEELRIVIRVLKKTEWNVLMVAPPFILSAAMARLMPQREPANALVMNVNEMVEAPSGGPRNPPGPSPGPSWSTLTGSLHGDAHPRLG